MTGVIEAAGNVATGAAWSRAAEPSAGEQVGRAGHGACLNCGTGLTGRYCHACGQSSHVHRTLISIVHDLLHGVFHFEGKIWRTIPMLVLHPGQLTRRYIDGERAKFVSPLALFLFTVFLMFAAFSWTGASGFADSVNDRWQGAAPKLEQQRSKSVAVLATLERERATLVARRESTARIDRTIAEQRSELAALTRVAGKVTAAPGKVDVNSRVDWLERALNKAKANPALVIYKVQSATYKFSWALIFLSTPFVALLFLWRRRFSLYDHATFVTYSISFMSLLTILLTLLTAANTPRPLLLGLLSLVPPIHMFAQLRGAYHLSVLSALWRTFILSLGSTMILATFFVGVVALEIGH